MVLAMSRPFKHPKTGVYYFRKAVPDDLRAVLGKREVKISLKTKDPAEAKARHTKVAAEVENQWKAFRAKPEHLTHRQVVALAGETYREFVDLVLEQPGPPKVWEHMLRIHRQAREAGKLAEWIGESADKALQKRGLNADDDSRARLIEELDKAYVQASTHLRQIAEGDYRPDPNADRFPEWPTTEAPKDKPAQSSLTGLFADWWREAEAAGTKPATHQSYRNTMTKFVAFLKHDDAGRVTKGDVIAFKDHRLAEVNPRTGRPISAKTVKDNDLSALKSVFGWAVNNGRLSANPATGITIKLGKKAKVRPKYFTDAEAKALLSAAWNLERGGENEQTYLAKRWAPWLLAYTGARLGEMVQLRKEDLRQEEDHWVLSITPEAGTVKTNEARDVVLHDHLVELGFPRFVASCKHGHLFLSSAPDGDIRGRWLSVKNRVTDFVRTIITDPNVSPNHGWRHTFKTIGREVGMNPTILDAIQGQAPRTVADEYGGVTVKALALEIAKFPRYKLG